MPVNKVRRRGSYAPLSARYYKDTAVIEAGEKAELLYVRSLAFCADMLSDGFISDAQLIHCAIGLSSVRARVTRLVETNLWERTDGGYMVRSWLYWNRSRDDILQMAQEDNDRKKPQVSGHEPPPDPVAEETEGESDSDRNPNGIQEGSHARRPARAPSNTSSKARTTPELPLPSGGGSGGSAPDDASAPGSKTASRKRSARENGHRIPDDWWPTDADRAWFRESCPNLVGEGTPLTHEFIGYWQTKPGKDGRKLDWSLTWQTWMRRENRRRTSRPGRKQTSDIVATGLDHVAAMEAQEKEAERLASIHQLTRGA